VDVAPSTPALRAALPNRSTLRFSGDLPRGTSPNANLAAAIAMAVAVGPALVGHRVVAACAAPPGISVGRRPGRLIRQAT
jgi:hypothetical protein